MNSSIQAQGCPGSGFRLVILFLAFDSGRVERVLRTLREVFCEIRGLQTTVIQINNNSNLGSSAGEEAFDGFYHIRGDNQAWEFSGWQAGLDFLGPSLSDYDLVLVTNDALDNLKDLSGLAAIDLLSMAWVSNEPNIAVGLVSNLNLALKAPPFEWFAGAIGGKKVHKWLCSAFILSTPRVFLLLGSLISFQETRDLFPRLRFPISSPVLSPSMVRLMVRHQTKIWRSSYQLNESVLPFFAEKVRSVANEMALSLRLRSLGVRFVDLRVLPRLSLDQSKRNISKLWAALQTDFFLVRTDLQRRAAIIRKPQTRN